MQTKGGSVKMCSCIWSKGLDQSKLGCHRNVYDSWESPTGNEGETKFQRTLPQGKSINFESDFAIGFQVTFRQ